MPYFIGVDLGTTYTAAATRRGDRVEMADLGTRTATIPSVVYLREDGAVLTGEAATRRGVTDPGRLAREFKRRMGDTTAILLGGVPYSVDALMARMLEAVVAAVSERQGESPSAIAVAHPANWGHYKKDLLEQAIGRADLDNVTMITEPEAAAVHYATQERLEPGAVVAVYDLGGGTFDAAMLRKTVDGFELLGEPQGIERLGGIDFDEAVFRHVVVALRGALDDLDPDDPVAQAAVSRLREECVAAKEALSGDTEVSVPVLLPNMQTEVRLTRGEFEAMIRPALADTLVVMNRAMRSAGVSRDQVHSVLMVGGSSRIPLISQLVGAELGRPVALDVHPKHSVALGAAIIAGGGVVRVPSAVPAPPASVAPSAHAAAPATPAAAPVVPVHAAPSPAAPVMPPPAAPSAVPGASHAPSTEPAVVPAPAPAATSTMTTPVASTRSPDMADPRPDVPPPFAAAPVEPTGDGASPGKRTPLLIGAAVVAVLAVVGGVLAFGGGDDDAGASGTAVAATDATGTDTTDASPATIASETTLASEITEPASTATTIAPAVSSTAPLRADPCEGITDTPCITLDSLRVLEGGAIEVSWAPNNFEPDLNAGFHAHLFWNNAEAFQASTDAPADVQVVWEAVDTIVHTSGGLLVMSNRPPDATGVCVTVGLAPAHNAPNPELFDCIPLPTR